jgi:putative ABC transport system permease protein
MSDTTLSWGMAWRLARRDLSARFRGLRLLLACLFLGVGALAATGTLTATINHNLATKGRQTLGGDVQFTLWQRGLNAQERAALGRYGTLSEGSRMQAMASFGDTTAPIELKAVDQHWPLVGRLTLADGRQVGAPPPGGAWLSDGAAQRLGIAPGQHFAIAGQSLTALGIIADEPDRLSEGFALGPTIITDAGFPHRAGLDAPGAMIRTRTRMACAQACDALAIADRLKAQLPSSGIDIRTRDKAAPGAENFIGRMGDFLDLVGLAALMIAGLGIGGGTASYLEARRQAIATLKVLGATSADIARIYVAQIAAAALAGSLAGLVVGTAVVPLLTHALSGVLPVDEGLILSPLALGRAGGWGLLVALVFAAPPLAAARDFPAMALMRARVAGAAQRFRRAAVVPVALGLVAIVALAFAGSANLRTTALFIVGAVGSFALLGALGWGLRALAARLPRPRDPIARMALANLHRPGAQTGRLVTALGFGLSAFVLLAVVQSSLDTNIAARVPAKAPDYFAVDLPPDQLGTFTQAVAATAPGAHIRTVPALRGAILAYGPQNAPTRVADLKELPDDAWALKGERGLTFSDAVPEGNTVTEGSWWTTANAGEAQVSVDEKLAKTIGLHLGDTITIGLLGVERSAKVTSFRRIDWDSFGFNYVLVLSPGALAGAPYKLAATISLDPAHKSGAVKGALLSRLTKALPGTSVVEVGPLLSAARDLLGQVSTAILAAASIAVLAGIAVLIGAIAAARASRLYDNTILRVLGASRGQLLALQMAEYGLLAGLLALVALALGSGLGWLVVVKLFSFEFLPNWPHVLLVLGAGLVVVLGFAFASSLPLLNARPARALREL